MRLTGIAWAVGIAVTSGFVGLATDGHGASINLCRISGMRVASEPVASEKTEQHTATFKLTNSAPTACKLDGYPVIALFDSWGRLLPFAYAHRGDQMITAARPTSIDLRSGDSAFFAVNKNVCITHTTRAARTLRIALPGSPARRSIGLHRYPIIDYCEGTDPGATITVSPIERTRQGTACLSQGSCRRKH
jgi:hypothetical protein